MKRESTWPLPKWAERFALYDHAAASAPTTVPIPPTPSVEAIKESLKKLREMNERLDNASAAPEMRRYRSHVLGDFEHRPMPTPGYRYAPSLPDNMPDEFDDNGYFTDTVCVGCGAPAIDPDRVDFNYHDGCVEPDFI